MSKAMHIWELTLLQENSKEIPSAWSDPDLELVEIGQNLIAFSGEKREQNITLKKAMSDYVFGHITDKAPCLHTRFQKTKNYH